MGVSPADATRALPAKQVKAQAYGLGFDLVGIARLGPAETHAAYQEWIAHGMQGDMEYLVRGAEKRGDARLPYPGVVSAVVVGLDYGGRESSGPVARYARGDDYHDLMWARLDELRAWMGEQLGRPVHGKSYVDTGPILERDLARRAGLGWQGKNTMLINPRIGSFFFLGSLVVDLELEADASFPFDRCGDCRRCLDACPTNALVEPRRLDARRCISYLTIEQKGEIPLEFREAIAEAGLVYGCDICQEVCPFNRRFARELSEDSPFRPSSAVAGMDARSMALKLLAMSQSEFSAAFKGSPMKRAKLAGLRRNAAVVLGNAGAPDDVPALIAALSDPEPLVRGHAAWALGRLASPEAVEALRGRSFVEDDAWVSAEIESALAAES
ncbi:MAG: tRNA epoxyqueuosine(34) reductase QueG [Gemmatimonadaceae bacterium]